MWGRTSCTVWWGADENFIRLLYTKKTEPKTSALPFCISLTPLAKIYLNPPPDYIWLDFAFLLSLMYVSKSGFLLYWETTFFCRQWRPTRAVHLSAISPRRLLISVNSFTMRPVRDVKPSHLFPGRPGMYRIRNSSLPLHRPMSYYQLPYIGMFYRCI